MSDELDFEEKLFYGGQISGKHPVFMDLAMLASYGFPYWLLSTVQSEEWKKLSPMDKVKQLIKISGQIEFINNSSELTKLSAIMGDTRKNYDQTGLRDELSARLYKSAKP